MSKVQVDGKMDIEIKYSANDCLELSRELASKKQKISDCKQELKEATADIKAEIRRIELEIESDIQTLRDGVRKIEMADIKAELDKSNNLVIIRYGDQVVAKEKYSEKYRNIFGDIVHAAIHNED